MTDPNPRVSGAGIDELRKAGIEVILSPFSEQVLGQNIGFVHKMTTGKPYVRMKMAVTMDGYSADYNAASKWITGESARQRVHEMRAQAGAVVTGSGTVISDNPSLNARLDEVVVQPIRVVLDSTLRTSPDAELFKQPGRVVIFTHCESINPSIAAKAEVIAAPESKSGIDLPTVIDWIGTQNCNDVLVEAGPRL